MNNESQKSFPLWSLLFGTLTTVFIALKLTGSITWSWLWVFSPLWLPTVSVLSVGLFAVSLYCAILLIKKAVGK